MPDKLKRCPFCGGAAKVISVKNGSTVYKVKCTEDKMCGAATGWSESRAEAVKKWNERKNRNESDTGANDSDPADLRE